MAPTAIIKLERERDNINTRVKWTESKVADHATIALTEAKVDYYLQEVTKLQDKINENQEAICTLGPTDIDPYNAEYIKLLDSVSDLQCDLLEIKKTFPTTSSATSSRTATSTSAEIRLPRLELHSLTSSSKEPEHLQPEEWETANQTNQMDNTKDGPAMFITFKLKHVKCSKFISMTVSDRSDFIKKHSMCSNCLREGHTVSKCNNSGTCKVCSSKHSTMLHKQPTTTTTTTERPKQDTPSVLGHHSINDAIIKQTILATAIVNIQDCYGQHQPVRVLLDGGSTASFITESCVQKLGLKRTHTETEVTGLAVVSMGTTRGITSTVIRPHFDSNNFYTVNCLIMSKVTSILPSQPCDPTVWPHLQGLQLADPNFYQPSRIDMLLGADIFWNLLLDGRKVGSNETPIGIKSTLGWLIAGNLNSVSTEIANHHAEVDLNACLLRFWEIESVPTKRILTQEEEMCENHFQTHHQRDATGRFVVSLPKKQPEMNLGQSRDIAVRRFKQLERRFSQNPDIHKQYIEFMNEYLSLGHMQLLSEEEVQRPTLPTCYIPHHFVCKESSTTTKLRVVFDASAKTSNGVSLNDTLLVGPTLQETLISILTRFRTHVVAFTADVAKMYRQIQISSPDNELQRIVWRENSTHPIKDYKLVTVTYGTASAPYLATKALQQLAIDEKDSLPLASKVASNDFYVDDLMSGAPSVEEALQLQCQLLELMKRGGLNLRKWTSNSAEVLEALPPEQRESHALMKIDTDPTVKILGVFWNPQQDIFIFKITSNDVPTRNQLTKRHLLSEIAKIFDPLGWLAPIIIRAKIIIQQLWKLQCEWDDILPESIQQEWLTFRENLHSIEQLTINRAMITSTYTEIHLVGFCDSSEKAYAAVVYLCVYSNNTSPIISLVSSKTRVAPTKQISLPRLELCGAVILAQLMTSVNESSKVTVNKQSAWTDSTVVRAWLQSHPSRWKTFVANRVTEVQALLPATIWGHVKGIENPADCASRGLDPTELKNHPLWWKGPHWLSQGHLQLQHQPSTNVK